jgi:hypothetical protein
MDTDPDSPSEMNEGITGRYGGIESEDDDCEYLYGPWGAPQHLGT